MSFASRALAIFASSAALVVSLTVSAQAGSGPVYSQWSTSSAGLSGRVSPPSADQAKTYVQVRRSSSNASDNAGQRQVQLTWRVGKGKLRSSKIRAIAKGRKLTFVSSATPCHKQIRVTLMGRGRLSSSEAWSAWQSASYTFSRSC